MGYKAGRLRTVEGTFVNLNGGISSIPCSNWLCIPSFCGDMSDQEPFVLGVSVVCLCSSRLILISAFLSF